MHLIVLANSFNPEPTTTLLEQYATPSPLAPG
jgi:hypothetical protein